MCLSVRAFECACAYVHNYVCQVRVYMCTTLLVLCIYYFVTGKQQYILNL